MFKPPAISITFSGLDGAGKSTIAKAVHEILGSTFARSIIDHYKVSDDASTHSAFKRLQRRCTSEATLERQDLLALFIACDYLTHVCGLMSDSANNNSLIVFDRYIYDLIVTQRVVFDHSFNDGECILASAPRPTFAFYVDVACGTALARIKRRGRGFRPFECEAILQRKRDQYFGIASQYGLKIINGENPLSESVEEVLSTVMLGKIF